MAEAEAGSELAPRGRVRPLYKIVSYIAAWLVGLFATNPDGGLWALAWMFPLGLAALATLLACNALGCRAMIHSH